MIQDNPDYFPEGQNHFLIDGPAGKIEMLTTTPKKAAINGIGVVCHPNPIQEGTMLNKVVHTVARGFDRKGLSVIRFNFRSVGKSEGEHDYSKGEVDDLLAVLEWAKKISSNSPIWLSGFSFGAFIAAKAATIVPIHQLYTIAPVVNKWPYHSLATISCPVTAIIGADDELVSVPEVKAWYNEASKTTDNMQLHVVDGASHFFHGKLIEVRDIVEKNFISYP